MSAQILYENVSHAWLGVQETERTGEREDRLHLRARAHKHTLVRESKCMQFVSVLSAVRAPLDESTPKILHD